MSATQTPTGMQTYGTVLGYCAHITLGQRELRNGIRTAPICPEIIAKPASRSPDSTFWGASRLFLRCRLPTDAICSGHSGQMCARSLVTHRHRHAHTAVVLSQVTTIIGEAHQEGSSLVPCAERPPMVESLTFWMAAMMVAFMCSSPVNTGRRRSPSSPTPP
eukprot:scaffold30641_cov129-Isochrysis_galbana.AAC.4